MTNKNIKFKFIQATRRLKFIYYKLPAIHNFLFENYEIFSLTLHR
jgi:hypothetical protein